METVFLLYLSSTFFFPIFQLYLAPLFVGCCAVWMHWRWCHFMVNADWFINWQMYCATIPLNFWHYLISVAAWFLFIFVPVSLWDVWPPFLEVQWLIFPTIGRLSSETAEMIQCESSLKPWQVLPNLHIKLSCVFIGDISHTSGSVFNHKTIQISKTPACTYRGGKKLMFLLNHAWLWNKVHFSVLTVFMYN